MRRIREELGHEAPVVATGGLASVFEPELDFLEAVDLDLAGFERALDVLVDLPETLEPAQRHATAEVEPQRLVPVFVGLGAAVPPV